MKKILAFSVILMAVCSSCYDWWEEYPEVIQKLSEEDLATVPYTKGQQFYMTDQNNDTLLWTVNTDTIENHLTNYDRLIDINSMDNNHSVNIILSPNKKLHIRYYHLGDMQLYAYYELNNSSPRTLVIDNDTLYNVYVSSDDPNKQIIYSINQGIIRIQTDSNYLKLIP